MKQYYLFLLIILFSIINQAHAQEKQDIKTLLLQTGTQELTLDIPSESFTSLVLLLNLELNDHCLFESEEYLSLKLNNDDASSEIKKIEFARIYLPSYHAHSDCNNMIEYRFDLTLWQKLIHNNSSISIYYKGLICDLKLSLSCEFEIGEPSVNVVGIFPLWESDPEGFPYGAQGVDKKYLPTRELALPENTHSAFISILVSGVKQEGTLKASSRFYFLDINEKEIGKRSIWREDCGLNPIFPQHEHWYENNHNWCPGLRVNPLLHRLDEAVVQDKNLRIDLRFQQDINQSSGVKSYITSAVLFALAEPTKKINISISEIIAPNTNVWHHRYNPICGNPIILIQNNGKEIAESITFNYGYNYQTDNKFRWQGSLGYMEQEIVYLPPPNWYFYDNDDEPQSFTVHVSGVNGEEKNIVGGKKTSPMALAQAYPGKLTLEVHTDNEAAYNGMEIYNELDELVFTNANFENHESYKFDIDLPPGCYEMIFYDAQGNGLTLDEDNKSCLIIRDQQTDTILTEYKGDFGVEIREQFMILK